MIQTDKHLWTLDEALDFIRCRETAAVERGYNLTLGGSILSKGWSDHDLDIICVPLHLSPVNRLAYCRFVAWLNLYQPGGIVSVGGWNGLSNKIETQCPRGRKVDWFIYFDTNT